MKEKISAIVDLGYRENVDAFIQTGDWWNTPMPSFSVVNFYMKLWYNGIDVSDNISRAISNQNMLFDLYRQLKDIDNKANKIQDVIERDSMLRNALKDIIKAENLNKLEVEEKTKNLIPIYLVAGNHELYGNNIATINRTMLGFLTNIGLLNLLDRNVPVIIKKNNNTIAITGTHYHADIDKKGFESDYIVENKMGDKHIHVVHGMASIKSMGSIIRHTLIDDIKGTAADLTVIGHEHKGFEPIEVNGKYFVNPGSVPRLSKNDDHSPKVYLAKIYKDRIDFEEILLPAKPNKVIFDMSAKIEKEEQEIKLAEYRQKIRAAGNIGTMDTFEFIDRIAEKKGISAKIRDGAKKEIALAMDRLGRGKVSNE